jgi:PadR family transcriptional regulator PadR
MPTAAPSARTSSAEELDLLKGTLDVMILKALSWGPMHGFGVAKWIRLTTDELLTIEDSALYPALHRMEHRGLIAADWKVTENKRRAKYYTLTITGRQQLRARVSSWDRYARAVTKVVHATVNPREALS